MRTSSVRHLLPLCALLFLGGCDDHTVLTGPDAVAAAERVVAETGRANALTGPHPRSGSTPPLFILDGLRVEDPQSNVGRGVLSDIRPEDIERIEVLKVCRAQGYFGADVEGGVILIFTKGFDRSSWKLPEYSDDRAEACRVERDQRR